MEDGKEISQYELAEIWREQMVKWLSENGYSKIKSNGEINVAYSEIPTSKVR